NQFGNWIADVERPAEQYRGRYQLRLDEANGLLKAAPPVAPAAAAVAEQVAEYLAAAKVAPGNPWCASFVTWSLEQAGHKMPGGGWAAVATWVQNAEQGSNGLKIVSADQA